MRIQARLMRNSDLSHSVASLVRAEPHPARKAHCSRQTSSQVLPFSPEGQSDAALMALNLLICCPIFFSPRTFFRRIRRPKRLLAASPTTYGRLTAECRLGGGCSARSSTVAKGCVSTSLGGGASSTRRARRCTGRAARQQTMHSTTGPPSLNRQPLEGRPVLGARAVG